MSLSQRTPADPPPSYDDSQRPAPARPRGPPGPPPPLNMPNLNWLRNRRVVLASASPRRKQLLAHLGLTRVDIIPSSFAEDLPHSLDPLEYVLRTASAKAMDVYRAEIDNKERGEPALVISADTIIVSHDGQILEKPRSEKAHIDMLTKLRDEGSHKVYTAVAVMTPNETAIDPGYNMETHVEETTVKFDKNATDELILAYVRTRDGCDKAGGYGLQSAGSILIERIEGSYDNVIGLPVRPLLQLIDKVLTPEDDKMDFGESDEDDI